MDIVPYEKVDASYLNNHPEIIYVHDENLHSNHLRRLGRNCNDEWYENDKLVANRYGFITYIYNNSFQPMATPHVLFNYVEYRDLVYPVEELLLIDFISNNKDKCFLIDPLGYGDLNKYLIFDYVIKPRLYESLKPFNNGMLLWGDLDSRYLTK